MTPPANTSPPAGAPEPTRTHTSSQTGSPDSTPTAQPGSSGRATALRGTPIRDYDPDLTAEDYAAIARVRDEIRSRNATLPPAPRSAPQQPARPRSRPRTSRRPVSLQEDQ